MTETELIYLIKKLVKKIVEADKIISEKRNKRAILLNGETNELCF